MTTSACTNKKICVIQGRGERKYQEDSHASTHDSTCQVKTQHWFAAGVFDGHGGRETSSWLRENALVYITQRLEALSRSTSAQIQSLLIQYCREIDRLLLRHGVKDGSTAVMMFLYNGKDLYVVNIGDSRFLLITEAGKLLLETKDQSAARADQEEKERVRQSGGKFVIDGKNGGRYVQVGDDQIMMTRSMGDFHFKRDAPVLICDPDIYFCTLRSSDPLLYAVLGSDGIFDEFTSTDLARKIVQAKPGSSSTSCRELTLDMKSNTTYHDNYTLLVLPLN